MNLYIANDHAAPDLKCELVEHIVTHFPDITIHNLGTDTGESVDYPSYGRAVAEKVVADSDSLGIVICGTGIGISIAANKVAGARCALCTNSTMAQLTREHNDANILALGARITGVEVAKDIVGTFLKTSFEGGRHQQRVDQIEG